MSLKVGENASTGLSKLPERELLLAVLDRSVLDFHSGNLLLRREAKDWLFSEDLPNNPEFSFSWVCEHLGLDSMAVRKHVKHLGLNESKPQGRRWLRTKVCKHNRSSKPNNSSKLRAGGSSFARKIVPVNENDLHLRRAA